MWEAEILLDIKNIRMLAGGAATIGFSLYSISDGVLQVGRHEVTAISRADSPALFWVVIAGLILTGAIFLMRGLKEGYTPLFKDSHDKV